VNSTTVIIGIVLVVVAVSVIWRLASQRHSLPCPAWLSWLVELDNPFARTNRAAVIVEHLAIEAGMSVVDVGCGPGRLTIPVARQVGEGGTVVALDIQAGMLERARHKAQQAGLNNIEFIQAGIGEGKLPLGQFDRALLVTVLGEIPEQQPALQEIFSALKPGGILSVTEIIFDPHFQRRSSVTKLATEAGFQEQAFFGNRVAYTLNFVKPSV